MSKINISGSNYTIEKGSNLWNVAKTICNQSGKVSNADVVKEMNRLAKLNNCSNFEELGKKFGKIGNSIKVSEEKPATKTKPSLATNPKNTSTVKDSTINVESKFKKENINYKMKNDSTQNKIDSTKIVTNVKINPIKNDSTTQNKGLLKSLSTKVKTNEEAAVKQEVMIINFISDNKTKIIEWNKQNKTTKNYILVDKKTCTATVYNPNGKALKSFEVGVGKEFGDNLNDGFGVSGKTHKTTPAGEYNIEINHSEQEDYGKMRFSLGDKGNMAKNDDSELMLHKIPNSLVKERKHLFKDGNVNNNRMSYGCVNFLEEDFNELQKYVGKGSKVYILPEETDNKLQLAAKKDGKLEFQQTKYNPQRA